MLFYEKEPRSTEDEVMGDHRRQSQQGRLSLELFELARVLVRFDRVASFIVNADHGIMCEPAAVVIPIAER
jgi:hypothetical protein